MFASSMDGVPRFIPAQTQGHAETRGELEDEELFGYQLCPFRTSSNVLTDGFLIVFQGGLQKMPAAGGGKQTRDLKGREWQNRKYQKRFLAARQLFSVCGIMWESVQFDVFQNYK